MLTFILQDRKRKGKKKKDKLNFNSEKEHNIWFGLETGCMFLGQSIRLNQKH